MGEVQGLRAEAGRHGDPDRAQRAERAASAIRCTNYDDCGVSYPLPARAVSSRRRVRPAPKCGAPIVVVNTARGPWRICVNMDCPTKEKKPVRGRKTTTKARARQRRRRLKKATAAKKTTHEEVDCQESSRRQVTAQSKHCPKKAGGTRDRSFYYDQQLRDRSFSVGGLGKS